MYDMGMLHDLDAPVTFTAWRRPPQNHDLNAVNQQHFEHYRQDLIQDVNGFNSFCLEFKVAKTSFLIALQCGFWNNPLNDLSHLDVGFEAGNALPWTFGFLQPFYHML